MSEPKIPKKPGKVPGGSSSGKPAPKAPSADPSGPRSTRKDSFSPRSTRKDSFSPDSPAAPDTTNPAAQPGGANDEKPHGATATAKDVAGGALKGAAGGTKLSKAAGGGVQGAVVGAAEGALKNKKVRNIAIIVVLAQPVMILIVVLAAIMGMLNIASSIKAAQNENSIKAATASGITNKVLMQTQEIASNSGVPWEIVAAVEFVQKQSPATGGLGLQGLDKKRVEDGEFGNLTVADAKNDRKSRTFIAQRLATELAKSKYDSSSITLDAGALDDEESDNGVYRKIDDKNDDSKNESAKARKMFVPAIAALPLAGNPEAAEEIYTVALRWALGESMCRPMDSIYVGGDWTSPVEATSVNGFEMRIHPITGQRKFHTGMDLSGGAGQNGPIYAASGGKVTMAGANGAAWGNTVKIDHGGGYETQYSHLKSGSMAVNVGDVIKVGTKVAVMGSTGYSTGAHLHFEVHAPDGTPGINRTNFDNAINPLTFLAERGVKLGAKPGASTDKPISEIDHGLPDLEYPEEDAPEEPEQEAGTALGDSFTGPSGDEGAAEGAKFTIKKDQIENAQSIVKAGRELKVSDAGLVIGLMTTMVESHMVNVNHGDRDSLGLFQQRTGWGSAEDRTNPEKSAGFFFSALLKHTGWEELTPNDAAQAVQRSGFPDRYGPWEPFATKLLAAIGGHTTDQNCGSIAGEGVRIVDYNVCAEKCAGDLADWNSDRVKRVSAQILDKQPDIITVQETGKRRIETKALSTALKADYGVAAYHRSRIIYYDKATFTNKDVAGKILPRDGFTLQARPGSWTRFGVYATLRHKTTGKIFIVSNSHPTPGKTVRDDEDREIEMKIVLGKVKDAEAKYPDAMVVHAGDFNSYGPKTSRSFSKRVNLLLVANGFLDSLSAAKQATNKEYNSANQLNSQTSKFKTGKHIDHIYLPKGTPVLRWGLELSGERSPYARMQSDHNMVWADIGLKATSNVPAADECDQACQDDADDE